MSENRQEYQERVEKEFNRLAEQLGRFMARVETRARREYDYASTELEEKSKNLREKLHTLKGSSAEAWKELKPGVDRAWEELKEAFSKARQRFSEQKSSSASSR